MKNIFKLLLILMIINFLRLNGGEASAASSQQTSQTTKKTASTSPKQNGSKAIPTQKPKSLFLGLGYKHSFANNTNMTINLFIIKATCKDDCVYNVAPKSTANLNTSGCCIQSVTWWATDADGNFKGGSSGRFPLVCHGTSWSIDPAGQLDGIDVYDLKRLS